MGGDRAGWGEDVGDSREPDGGAGDGGADRERIGHGDGVCDVVDCLGPLTAAEYRKNARKAGMRPMDAELGYYAKTYAWVLANARWLKRAVVYEHPSGAVIWVNLKDAVERAVRRQLPTVRG